MEKRMVVLAFLAAMLLVLCACEPDKKKDEKEDTFDLPGFDIDLRAGIYFSEGECDKVFKDHGLDRWNVISKTLVLGESGTGESSPDLFYGLLELDIHHLKKSGGGTAQPDVAGPYGALGDFSFMWEEDQSMYLQLLDMHIANKKETFKDGIFGSANIEGRYTVDVGCKVEGGYLVEYIVTGAITKGCSLVLDVQYTPKEQWVDASDCPGAAAYEYPIEAQFPSFCVFLPGVYNTATYKLEEGIFIQSFEFKTPFESSPSDEALIKPFELNKILKKTYGCEIPMR